MAISPQLLEWLLEPEEPALRYRTLRELLDRPSWDAEVDAARRRIANCKAARRIFDQMHPDGYWLQRDRAGVQLGAGVEYGQYRTTHFCLSYLAELGLDRRDERVARAAERYLSLQQPSGDFWRHLSCLNGYNVRTFCMLGYREDARVQRTIALLNDTLRPDGGYLCDVHEGRRRASSPKSCIRGSAKVLLAFAELPDSWASPRCKQLVQYFVERGGVFRSDEPTAPVTKEAAQTLFPFGWGCGLIDVLLALSRMGHGQAPELDRAWSLLESKRLPDGRFVLDATPSQALLSGGKRGAPSKWVTFYALLAHKYRVEQRVR